MKPFRLKLTHHLVLSYGLYKEMNCYRPHHAQLGEMTSMFHSVDYINFLKRIDPELGNMRYNASQSRKYNVGPNEDCPAFAGLYEFSQLTTGASLDAAVQLCLGQTDIAINWAGGFHHAKKASASGFCYVNGACDIFAIITLLVRRMVVLITLTLCDSIFKLINRYRLGHLRNAQSICSSFIRGH